MVDNTAFTGKHGSFLVGEEASYGSGGTADKDIGIINSLNYDESSEYFKSRSINARNNQYDVRIKYGVSFSLEGTYQHSRILYYTLGSVATTGASPPYTHTITEADVIPSLKIQYCKSHDSTGNQRLVTGCKINTLTLSVDSGSALTFSAEIIGKSTTFSDSTAVQTIDDIEPAPNSQVTVQIGSDDSEPSTDLKGVQGFDININNNLIQYDAINTVTINEAIAGNRDYTGTLRIAEDDDSDTVELIKRMLGSTTSTTPADVQTTSALELYWTNGDSSDTLKLVLYGVSFGTLTTRSVPGELDVLELPFEGKSLGLCEPKDDISEADY